ncbi:WhiB family transcriptional regulator [Streptomyces nigra]|uniref:WhiB family transcriptional regulator n=1 Tax=Streptomyces nigra TaxID=1827580 RepID=UPI003684BB4A
MTPAVSDGGSRVWELRAACREWDADLWFTRRTWPLAVAICTLCPVLEPCRAAVLRRERGLPRCRRQGVVAGLTGPQRHALEQADHGSPGSPVPAELPGERPAGPTAPARSAVAPRPASTAAPEPARSRPGEALPTAAVAADRPPPTAAVASGDTSPDPAPPQASRSGSDEAPPSPPPPDRRTSERGDAPSRIRPAPCGTRAAYQRHLRRGEPVDAACRAANTYEAGRYRRTGTTRARPPRPPA